LFHDDFSSARRLTERRAEARREKIKFRDWKITAFAFEKSQLIFYGARPSFSCCAEEG
jgi:hypothetical protein